MMRSWRIVLGACALVIAGCMTSSTQHEGADTTATASERSLFEAEATERLAATRARLDSLQRDLPQSASEFRSAMQSRAAALAAERDSVGERLVTLKAATDERWLEMKLTVAGVLDSLERRIDRLSDDLRKPDQRPRN